MTQTAITLGGPGGHCCGGVAVLEEEEDLCRRDARPHLGQREITARRGRRRGLPADRWEENVRFDAEVTQPRSDGSGTL